MVERQPELRPDAAVTFIPVSGNRAAQTDHSPRVGLPGPFLKYASSRPGKTETLPIPVTVAGALKVSHG
jgi:hypothetical protein